MPSQNITGATGEYYVAAELSRRGFVATITLKNTPNIDVLAASADGKKSVSIQVKTRRIEGRVGNDFPLSTKALMKKGNKFFYIFVSLKTEDPPDFYVIPQPLVVARVEPRHQEWRLADSNRKSDLRVLKQNDLEYFEKYHSNWKILDL